MCLHLLQQNWVYTTKYSKCCSCILEVVVLEMCAWQAAYNCDHAALRVRVDLLAATPVPAAPSASSSSVCGLISPPPAACAARTHHHMHEHTRKLLLAFMLTLASSEEEFCCGQSSSQACPTFNVLPDMFQGNLCCGRTQEQCLDAVLSPAASG